MHRLEASVIRKPRKLKPTWDFPFRVGNGCRMVAQPVWNVRWHRHLTRHDKLRRAQLFRENTK